MDFIKVKDSDKMPRQFKTARLINKLKSLAVLSFPPFVFLLIISNYLLLKHYGMYFITSNSQYTQKYLPHL